MARSDRAVDDDTGMVVDDDDTGMVVDEVDDPIDDAVADPFGRLECLRCGAHYAPALTRHACPLCGQRAPHQPPASRWRFPDDPDDRLVAVAVVATLANLVLLALLTLAVTQLR